MADRYTRIWFARIVSLLTRSANRLNCSLMRFSMSPRPQYRSSYSACAVHLSPVSEVTTKRGFSFPVDMFGLRHHAPFPVPPALLRLPGAVEELGEQPRRLAGLVHCTVASYICRPMIVR